MEAVISAALCAVTFLLGAFALPKATDSFLRMKYRSMDRRWYRFLEKSRSAEPDQQSSTVRSWVHNQIVASKSQKLSRARLEALLEAGIIEELPDPGTLPDDRDESSQFTFAATPLRRVVCAVCASAAGISLAALGAPTSALAIACAIGLAMTAVCVCDHAARIIPYQLCIAYGVIALLWVLATRSPGGVPQSVLVGVTAAFLISLTEFVALKITGKSAIGGGDRKLIPLIAFQVGLVGLMPGLIALCVVALAMAIWALLNGRSRRSYLPFAPPLFAFAAAGTLWPFIL